MADPIETRTTERFGTDHTRIGVASGLSVVTDVSTEEPDKSSPSTKALEMLKHLKTMPITGKATEVNFSALPEHKVWVWEESGIWHGSIVQHDKATEVTIGKISGKTTDNCFVVYDTQDRQYNVPVNIVYLSLLNIAAEQVKQKLQSPSQQKVFATTLNDAKGENISNEDRATKSDYTTAITELGTIVHEIKLIKSAQEHQKRRDEIEPVYHAFAKIKERQNSIDELNAKFAEINNNSSLSDEQKTAKKTAVQSQIDKLNADLTTSRDLTKDQKENDIDIQYKALVADSRLADIIEAHKAIQYDPNKTPPTPAEYAKYAKLVFADGYESIRERLVAKRIEIDRKIVENPNLIRDITGKLQNEKEIIDAQLDQLDEGAQIDPDNMWLSLFVRMQNGELTHEQSEVVKLALENPEDRDKTQKALLLALESNGFKSKYEKEAMNVKLQRIFETWGSTLLLFGMQKITKLLEDATQSDTKAK